MGCFFSCFRISDDRRSQTHLICDTVSSKAKKQEPIISQRPLSSLLLSEDPSPCKDKENSFWKILQHENDERELKAEAGSLKACGIPETHIEVWKVSHNSKDSSPVSLDSKPPKFHSWLPNESIESLKEQRPDYPPTPIQVFAECMKGTGSCISSGQITGMISGSSTDGIQVGSFNTEDIDVSKADPTAIIVSAADLATNKQCRNKSVHFECEDDATFSARSSSSRIASQNLRKAESASNYSVSKTLPCPTPLKLTDEMQTPGTAFPANLDTMGMGKYPQLRSQYVYSGLNPVGNFRRPKVLKNEDSNSHQISESLEHADSATPKSGMGRVGSAKELKVEASFSAWLKLPSTNEDNTNLYSGSFLSKKAYIGTSPCDRPIIGIVAAHWNEDEPSRISRKSWDGNGIPNSTNKYKEDQKVNWHATPFEERLEKALSDETFVSRRKHIEEPPPVNFDETDESDTAISQLRSSLKPVVSF